MSLKDDKLNTLKPYIMQSQVFYTLDIIFKRFIIYTEMSMFTNKNNFFFRKKLVNCISQLVSNISIKD